MKQTTKNILGIAAVVILSSGVAGVTTYKMLNREKPATFNELFEQNPSSLQLTTYNVTGAQPVDLTQAVGNSVHTMVHIHARQLSRTQAVQGMPGIFDFFFGDGRGQQHQIQAQPRVDFGSGVIISKDGYIVTNNHVAEDADETTVELNDDRELKGRIIGIDPSMGLAPIKIEDDDFPTIPIGNSDELKIGEWVLAVGNPFDLNSTAIAGIVGARVRAIGTTASNGQAANIQSFIRTDTTINQGNSGGALVDARGELAGVNTMLCSPTGAYSSYGFAIPTGIMTKVAADLKQFGTVQRVLLGITGTTLGTDLQMDGGLTEEVRKKADELGVKEGVLVAEVVEGDSAAGILKSGDVIVGPGDKKVYKFNDLRGALAKHRPGNRMKVKMVRDEKEEEFGPTLKNPQGSAKVVKDAGMELLSAAFKPISFELKRQLNLGYGLEVTGTSNGKMTDADVRKGFMILKANNVQMKSVEDSEKVLKAATQSPDQVLFTTGIFPSGRRASYAVDLTQE